MNHTLAERMERDEFTGYAYAYPHKTSYRQLHPKVRLSDAWQSEDKNELFLYVHLPFCEMRCGFCNLFTTVRPDRSFVAQTLDAICRQSAVVVDETEPKQISQIAFGGGTPSFLSIDQLAMLLMHVSRTWPINWTTAHSSFEISPATINAEKLSLLKSYNIDRISMGVQSFSQSDLKQLGRPQSYHQVETAIEEVQAADFPVFNLDLIYGADGQTIDNWLQTVDQAIFFAPEEVYLYPLYVRELTGLGRTGKSPSSHRRELFLAARDALLSAGYQQLSMRLFRLRGIDSPTDYCCQEDGMIGLGPGARSYTRSLHYSSEYAVGQSGVIQIIRDFNSRQANEFRFAEFGVSLNSEEQRRRYLIKSLLRTNGLDLESYQLRFGSPIEKDFPQVLELIDLKLGFNDGKTLRLNSDGLSWSDVIGPWLYSRPVASRMEACELT